MGKNALVGQEAPQHLDVAVQGCDVHAGKAAGQALRHVQILSLQQVGHNFRVTGLARR